jgi:hypothetical protein
VPPTPTLSSPTLARFERSMMMMISVNVCARAPTDTYRDSIIAILTMIKCVCARAQPDQHNEVSSSARARAHTHLSNQPQQKLLGCSRSLFPVVVCQLTTMIESRNSVYLTRATTMINQQRTGAGDRLNRTREAKTLSNYARSHRSPSRAMD